MTRQATMHGAGRAALEFTDDVIDIIFKERTEVAEIEALIHTTEEFAKILAKRPEVRSQQTLKVALWAFQCGWRLSERAYSKHLYANRLRAGGRVIVGGLKGAGARHGEREDWVKQARDRYAYHATELPGETRKVLCAIVGEELGVTGGTVAAWVPNPISTRRGRPRKK